MSHSEALAEESICVTFPGSFAFAQDDSNISKILRYAQNDILTHKFLYRFIFEKKVWIDRLKE